MDFITIATFDTSPEAHIAMGRLQAEGSDCHLAQTDWLYSIAVGGIKLQVAAATAERARRIPARNDAAEVENEG